MCFVFVHFRQITTSVLCLCSLSTNYSICVMSLFSIDKLQHLCYVFVQYRQITASVLCLCLLSTNYSNCVMSLFIIDKLQQLCYVFVHYRQIAASVLCLYRVCNHFWSGKIQILNWQGLTHKTRCRLRRYELKLIFVLYS